ncbi:hypothetical protein GCM10028827_13200 [Mucilaginibacter myungsuensis]
MVKSNSSNEKGPTVNNKRSEPDPGINLTAFVVIPDEIDGCSCDFYLSKKDEKRRRYLMVNDFGNTAFVSINNKVEKIFLKEHKEGSSKYLYSNDEYEIKIEITEKIDDGEETSLMKGIFTIIKGQTMLQKNFIGSCGC